MNRQLKKGRVGCRTPKPLSEIWKVTTMLPIHTVIGEEQVDEREDYDFQSATEYFTKLEEVFATFLNRPIRIDDLEELVNQCNRLYPILKMIYLCFDFFSFFTFIARKSVAGLGKNIN